MIRSETQFCLGQCGGPTSSPRPSATYTHSHFPESKKPRYEGSATALSPRRPYFSLSRATCVYHRWHGSTYFFHPERNVYVIAELGSHSWSLKPTMLRIKSHTYGALLCILKLGMALQFDNIMIETTILESSMGPCWWQDSSQIHNYHFSNFTVHYAHEAGVVQHSLVS
jgi:hypothetical protein